MDGKLNRPQGWRGLERVLPVSYLCAYCGNRVASVDGLDAALIGSIRVCPECQFPTFIGVGPHGYGKMVVPAAPPGNPIENVPGPIETLYEEARRSAGVGAFTASVLTCRKMLVDIACDMGDSYVKGKQFVKYVEFLMDHYFPPVLKPKWLDAIRVQGNVATHELGVQEEADALLLIEFVETLLVLAYGHDAKLAAYKVKSEAVTPPSLPTSPGRGNGPDPKSSRGGWQ